LCSVYSSCCNGVLLDRTQPEALTMTREAVSLGMGRGGAERMAVIALYRI